MQINSSWLPKTLAFRHFASAPFRCLCERLRRDLDSCLEHSASSVQHGRRSVPTTQSRRASSSSTPTTSTVACSARTDQHDANYFISNASRSAPGGLFVRVRRPHHGCEVRCCRRSRSVSACPAARRRLADAFGADGALCANAGCHGQSGTCSSRGGSQRPRASVAPGLRHLLRFRAPQRRRRRQSSLDVATVVSLLRALPALRGACRRSRSRLKTSICATHSTAGCSNRAGSSRGRSTMTCRSNSTRAFRATSNRS